MISALQRWWRRFVDLFPRRKTSRAVAVSVGSKLYRSADGITISGWLSPGGAFVPISQNYRSHREVASKLLGAASTMDPEQELERRGWMKFSRSQSWHGFHPSSRMTEIQREVIEDFYWRIRRPFPPWLKAYYD